MGDTGYRLDVASSEKIDVKTFYNLLKKGDITLDQFLASISVSKDAAKKACGDFIVAKIAVTTPGTKADIRTRDLPVKVAYPEIVRATPVEKNFSPKVGPKLKLRVKPGAAKLMVKRKLGKPKW